jgi:HSP20 family molecular chaperone IbpA
MTTASFDHGVLAIRVPTARAAKPKKIEVNATA